MARRASVYWAGRATLVRRPEDAPPTTGPSPRSGAATLGAALASRHHEERISLALDDLGERRTGRARARAPGRRRPSATAPVRCCATRTSPPTRTPSSPRPAGSWPTCASPARSGGHAGTGRRAAPPAGPTCVAPCVTRSAHGGEPVRRAFLEPAARPRRVVLLCDVSGSMEPYTRALVRFLHAAVVGRAPGRGLRPRHPAHPPDPAALVARPRRRAGRRPPTRWPTGRGARASATACARSTTPGVCGAWPAARSSSCCPTAGTAATPTALAEQMARLRRVAYRIVWVNPLKAAPGLRAAGPGHGRGAAVRGRLRRGPLARVVGGARAVVGGKVIVR